MKVKNMKIKYKSLKYIKIVFISLFFALSLLGCSKSSEELVQEKMSESEILLGNQKESFEGLEYKINQDIKKEDSNYYLAGIDNEYPVLEMDVVEEEKDFKEVNSDELEEIIKNTEYGNWSTLDELDNYSIETEIINSEDCYHVSYAIKLDEDNLSDNILTSNLKVDSLYIPTYYGLYRASIYTYAEDGNDYKFEEFIDTFNIDKLQNYTSNEKQEKIRNEELSNLKIKVELITCNENANEQERQIFNIRKQEVLNLIAQKASLDEINTAIDQVNMTNTDIQARIDQEDAARAAAEASQKANQQQSTSSYGGYQGIGNGYYCVDGTYVGNADPHARGRANACYGHGGFQVNH